MFHQKIYQGTTAFLITLLSVLLLNSNNLDARETHHSKVHLKSKSNERLAKHNRTQSNSKSSFVRNASHRGSKSINRAKGSSIVSNSLKSSSRSKGAAIHFGPGPGGAAGASPTAIHFGPGPGATAGGNAGTGRQSAKATLVRHVQGNNLPAIHFGPGPGSTKNNAQCVWPYVLRKEDKNSRYQQR